MTKADVMRNAVLRSPRFHRRPGFGSPVVTWSRPRGAGRPAAPVGVAALSSVISAGEVEVRPELAQLRDEVLVPAADDADVRDVRLPLGGECRDEVAEAAAEVGHADVRAV